MRKHRERFKTEAEARAFVQGVEYVNDSALEVVDVYQEPKRKLWVVLMEDSDY